MSADCFDTVPPRKVTEFRATVLPDGRWLLFHAQKNIAHTLNAPAGILWELCDGYTLMPGLISQLQELYPDTAEETLLAEARQTLRFFIDEALVICDAS